MQGLWGLTSPRIVGPLQGVSLAKAWLDRKSLEGVTPSDLGLLTGGWI